jgi:hypothetical protein
MDLGHIRNGGRSTPPPSTIGKWSATSGTGMTESVSEYKR